MPPHISKPRAVARPSPLATRSCDHDGSDRVLAVRAGRPDGEALTPVQDQSNQPEAGRARQQITSSRLCPGTSSGARWMHGGTGLPGHAVAIRHRLPTPNDHTRALASGAK